MRAKHSERRREVESKIFSQKCMEFRTHARKQKEKEQKVGNGHSNELVVKGRVDVSSCS